MRESIEFRIPEEHASRWLGENDGVCLGGSVRKLDVEKNDPRMRIIAEAELALKRQGRTFFAYGESGVHTRKLSWMLRSDFDLKQLPFSSLLANFAEPSMRTPWCRIKANRPLIIDVKRIPKGKSFAKTIAGEIVVAQHAVDLFKEHGVTGIRFHPVRAKGAKDLQPTGWCQLVVVPTNAENSTY